MTLDLWRSGIAFLCALCAAYAVVCCCIAVKRIRQGADLLCMPAKVMLGICIVLFAVSVGQGCQLLWWAHHDTPFAWYRSLILVPFVLLTLFTLTSFVRFIYRGRK